MLEEDRRERPLSTIEEVVEAEVQIEGLEVVQLPPPPLSHAPPPCP